MQRKHRLTLLGIIISIAVLAASAPAQQALPEGVTSKDATYYSEHVACHGRIFYPKGFDANGKSAGVVLAPGWAETAESVGAQAAQLAGRGVVAMAIDYRGWGKSGAFLRLAEPIKQDDRLRFAPFTAKVRFKRARLLPEAQIEDIRNAISYLQGEPGVDSACIGLLGAGYAGGHTITVAARDARVKAGALLQPEIAGRGEPEAAFNIEGDLRKDAIERARNGEGGTFQTGPNKALVDIETRQAAAEYRPFHDIQDVPTSIPLLFVIDEKAGSAADARAAADALKTQGNPVDIQTVSTGADEAAAWLAEKLRAP